MLQRIALPVLALVLVVSALAHGIEPASAITGTATGTLSGTDDIKVAWKIASTAKPKVRSIEIRRMLDNETAFALLKTKGRAPAAGAYVDKDLPTRYASYRLIVRESGAVVATLDTGKVDTYYPFSAKSQSCPGGENWETNAVGEINKFLETYLDRTRHIVHGAPVAIDVRLGRAARYRAIKWAEGQTSGMSMVADAKRYGYKNTDLLAGNYMIGASLPSAVVFDYAGDPVNPDPYRFSDPHRWTIAEANTGVGFGCAVRPADAQHTATGYTVLYACSSFVYGWMCKN